MYMCIEREGGIPNIKISKTTLSDPGCRVHRCTLTEEGKIFIRWGDGSTSAKLGVWRGFYRFTI